MRPDHALLTDVVLRDGLQDEPVATSVADRIAIAESLVAAGVRDLEVASFVNPRRVPQMAGAEEVVQGLPAASGVIWRSLALNRRGVDRAAAAGITHINLVVSASTAHSQANAGRSQREAIADFAEVVQAHPGIEFTGGVATAFVCPFEGVLDSRRVVEIARAYQEIGIDRLGFADTLGTASPEHVRATLDAVRGAVPDAELGVHLHDAKGQALETVDHVLDLGIHRFDSSTGGYGGCPFAPGAHGNIATADLVAHLEARGIATGIDLMRLKETETLISAALSRGETLPAA